jgi:hypothetical protein
MSLLMFALAPNEVVVLTDTLATTPAGGPYLFVSKCSVVPHLEMLVAFTRVAQVGQLWSHKLQTEMLARDIDLLDQHVPNALRAMAAQVDREFGNASTASTVYHLGYSESQACYTGYVYRSENDFASEVMDPGFRIKPVPEGSFEAPSSLDEMVALGIRVREEQDASPPADRVYIGGELIITAMLDRNVQIRKLYRFEDFDSHWRTMNINLS